MKAICCALLSLLMLFSCFALAEEEEDFDAYSRLIDVPGVGTLQYYAQNDPNWRNTYYEPEKSKSHRFMEGSGCGPTTVAMAIANQVPLSRLPELTAYARNPEKGFRFCPCSCVAECLHPKEHEIMTADTLQDYIGWLPVILANYATGNNHLNGKFRTEEAGTNIQLLKYLCEDYGIAYSSAHDFDEALAALRKGASVITTCKNNCFIKNSHYLYLAGADDTYLYIFDCLEKDHYGRDSKGYIEVLEPGFVRVKLEDVPAIRMYGFYMCAEDASVFE